VLSKASKSESTTFEAHIESAPSLTLLERAIGRAVERLEPVELTQLRRALTVPQAAIAFRTHRAIRDVVLGRDEHER
jgi:hypothetical protein